MYYKLPEQGGYNMDNFQSLVAFMPWTSIATLINLLLLTLGLKKFLFKPVQEVLDKRRKQIDDEYEEAKKTAIEAKEMKDEYTQCLESAKEEAADIVKSATQRANARSEELINTTRAETAALKEKAQEEILSERRKAATELKGEIADIALDIAKKVVEKEIDASTHKKMIDDAS